MASSHSTGSTYTQRQGSNPVRHTLVVTGSTSTDAVKWLRIKASAAAPVLLESQVAVSTVDGGGSPTISAGYTASGYTDLINAASLATAATGGTFLPANNATGKKLITADTDIYYKLGGTPDGVGVATLILDITTVNTATL